MIAYEFKGATSALYPTDGTWEIIEHENGGYSVRASKVYIRNSVPQDCTARSHFKPVKAPFFSSAMDIIALGAHLGASGEAKCFICLSTCSSLLIISCSTLEVVL